MKCLSVRAVALAACVLVLAACGVLPGGAAEIPSGTYVSNSGAGNDQLKLSAGSYLIVVDGASYEQGNYSSTGSQLTLTASDSSVTCAAGVGPAVYDWNLNNNLLTLMREKDDCAPRAQLLEQTWAMRQ